MLKTISTSFNATNSLQRTARVLITSQHETPDHQSVRYARNIKPWKNGPIELWKKQIYNYEYRKGRARKVLKLDLPDFDKMRRTEKQLYRMSPDEIRSDLRERGIVPNRKWMEKPIYVGDSARLMDPYVPPEGDGVASLISKERVSQQFDSVKGKGTRMAAMRKLRGYLDTFDPAEWALNEGQNIYIKAHEMLAEGNMEALYNLVTDSCLPKMLYNCELKTIRWKYLKALEMPRVVNVKVEENQGIAFAQLTVRFHSQQMLAIYDRFGRLVGGSEAIIKDVLEYVVFENRVSSTNGIWRIHDKIVPDWMKKDQSESMVTVVKSAEELIEETNEQPSA